MTVPMRASSIDSAMMPTSMEALAGITLLLAGDDRETVAALRAWVALGGATARACGADPEEVAAAGWGGGRAGGGPRGGGPPCPRRRAGRGHCRRRGGGAPRPAGPRQRPAG